MYFRINVCIEDQIMLDRTYSNVFEYWNEQVKE